jgi:vacuolar-type H+-ATPase subunit F/Vma7
VSKQSLVVIGHTITAQYFRLLGAVGLVVESESDLDLAWRYVVEHEKEIGGIALEGDLLQNPSKKIQKIKQLGIPLVALPVEGSATKSTTGLEELMVKALGMKLPQKDIL